MPLVTQWDDAKDIPFCNMSNTDTVNGCNDNLCYCTHMLDVKIGQVGKGIDHTHSRET